MRLWKGQRRPGGFDLPVKNRRGTTGETGRRGKEKGMSQNQRILQHMMKWGSITQREAYECYGVMRLGARIRDLKDAGHHIATSMEQGENRYGETTRYARYRLLEA